MLSLVLMLEVSKCGLKFAWFAQFCFGSQLKSQQFTNISCHKITLSMHLVFLIAMDGSDWAIHDSFLAARWRRLANFNYFIHDSYPGS